MTNEGIIRTLNLRIETLHNEIDYLRDPKVNPPSRHDGETVNEYANGLIRAYEKEIDFIKKLLSI